MLINWLIDRLGNLGGGGGKTSHCFSPSDFCSTIPKWLYNWVYRSKDFFFYKYSQTSVGICRGFRKSQHLLSVKSLRSGPLEWSPYWSNPENQLEWLNYTGIHLCAPKKLARGSQNQSGNLIKLKTVVTKYTYKVNLTYCKKLGRLTWFLYNHSTDLEKTQRNSCILILDLPCSNRKPQIFRVHLSWDASLWT